MDLDTALLRAFVVTANELHFGRAAGRLVLSQQALSKRIARLESLLGVELFERTRRSVRLSPAGERLVVPAREALSKLDAALAAAGVWEGPLTVDVLNEHLPPLRMVHQAIDRDPGLQLQVTMRKGDRDVVSDLRRGDFDLAFGRAGAVEPWHDELCRRLLMLEPVGLLVSQNDPLAGKHEITCAELRDIPLWFPAGATPAEWIDYLADFQAEFGLEVDYTGSTIGFEFFVGRITTGFRRATFIGTAMTLPPETGLTTLRIADPVPVFPWWAIWPRRVPESLVRRLLAGMLGGAVSPPNVPDRSRFWLPASDLACLTEDAAHDR
jgi:DNA-binding transcriptional LysR family regulator